MKAGSSGAGGTQLATNLGLLNEFLLEQNAQNRANIFDMEDNQFDRVLNYYITGDDKQPFLGLVYQKEKKLV